MKTKLLVTVSALILSGSMAFAQASEFAEARITVSAVLTPPSC